MVEPTTATTAPASDATVTSVASAIEPSTSDKLKAVGPDTVVSQRRTSATPEIALFFAAAIYLPLADIITVYLAAPIFVTALSAILLGEHVDITVDSYWERSDHFDMGLDLTAGQRGSAALGQVIARWISHLLGVDVAVEPLTELREAPLSWYVGLSADATQIGDAIWNGNDMDSALQARLVGLYRLNFHNPSDVIEKVRGEPVYLLVAMTAGEVLRLKPQNLVTGLPIRCEEAAN